VTIARVAAADRFGLLQLQGFDQDSGEITQPQREIELTDFDGHMQLFKVPASGGEPLQITFDPSDKTHPSWSPRGDQIAFTVFRYLAHFWLLEQ